MAKSVAQGRSGWALGVLLACACGDGDDFATWREPEALKPPPPELVTVQPIRPAPGAEAPGPVEPSPGVGGEPPGSSGNTPEPVASGGCRAPAGVSSAPSSIPEALALMNALPRPTTLECFLQSLERPLALSATSSALSLQPAPDERNPRMFISIGNLVMSVVSDGEASETLEFGYRTSPTRSIKAEVLFPLERDMTPARLFDRVMVGSSTVCGRCHTAELRSDFPEFPEGVFESNVLEPYTFNEVAVDTLRAEAAACDEAAEPGRCAMLSAIFDYGEVRGVALGEGMQF